MTNIIESSYENLLWSSGVISEFVLDEYLKKYVEKYHLYIGKTLDIFLPDTLEKRTSCLLSFSNGSKDLFKVFDGASVYEVSLLDQCFAANFEEEALGILYENNFDVEKALRSSSQQFRKQWKSDEIESYVELKKTFGGNIVKIFKTIIKNNLFTVTMSQLVDFDYQYFFTTDNMPGGDSENRSPENGPLLSAYHEERAKRLIDVFRKSERLLTKQKRKLEMTALQIMNGTGTGTGTPHHNNITIGSVLPPLPVEPNTLNNSSTSTTTAITTTAITTTTTTTTTTPLTEGGGGGSTGTTGTTTGPGEGGESIKLKRHRNLISRVDQIKTAYGSGITNLKNLKAYEQIINKKESPTGDTDMEDNDNIATTPATPNMSTIPRKSKRQKNDSQEVMNILTSSQNTLNPKNRIIIGINEILLCKLSRLIELMKESKKYETDHQTVLLGSDSRAYSDALVIPPPPSIVQLPILPVTPIDTSPFIPTTSTTITQKPPEVVVVPPPPPPTYYYNTNIKGVTLPSPLTSQNRYTTPFPGIQPPPPPTIGGSGSTSSGSTSSYHRSYHHADSHLLAPNETTAALYTITANANAATNAALYTIANATTTATANAATNAALYTIANATTNATATAIDRGLGTPTPTTCRFSPLNDIQRVQQRMQLPQQPPPSVRGGISIENNNNNNNNDSNSLTNNNRYTEHIESFLKAFLVTQCNYNELFHSIHEKGSVAIYPPLPNFNTESRSINPSINIIRISQHFSNFLSCFLDSALPSSSSPFPTTSATAGGGGETPYITTTNPIENSNENKHHHHQEQSQDQSFTNITINISTCDFFQQLQQQQYPQQQQSTQQQLQQQQYPQQQQSTQQQQQQQDSSSMMAMVAHVEFLWLAQVFTINDTNNNNTDHPHPHYHHHHHHQTLPLFSAEVRGILDCSFKDYFIFDAIIQFDFESLHRQIKSLKAL